MTSYYLELTQDAYEADTISVSDASTIADSGSGLAIFNVGDKIRLKGFYQTENQSEYTIATKAAGTITIAEGGLAAEAAGETITIQRVEYFSNGPLYKTSTTSKTRFHYPAVLGISPVVWYDDNGWIRLKDGVVEIGRKAILGDEGLTKFTITDKTQGFRILVRLASDDTILFDTVAIISDITQEAVSFLMKDSVPDQDLLAAMPDIDASTYDQGRVYPQIFGTIRYFDCPIVDNATRKYFSGTQDIDTAVGYILDVREDGVLLPFDGVQTSYTTGVSTQYGDYVYTALVDNPTESPTGDATDNTSWQYNAAGSPTAHFRATSTDGTFTLLSDPKPGTRITCWAGQAAIASGIFISTATIKAAQQISTGEKLYADTISFSNTNRIYDTEKRFLTLFDESGASVSGLNYKITVSGSTSNDGDYVVENIEGSGEYLIVTPNISNESAGADVKIEVFFGVKNYGLLSTDKFNFAFTRQIKTIEAIRNICDFFSLFFRKTKTKFLFYARDSYEGTITTDQFEIEQSTPPDLQLSSSVSAYRARWTEKVPITVPVILAEIERTTEAATGVDTGTIEEIKPYDTESNTIILAALTRKANIFANYDRFLVPYSKDGTGIDTTLVPGVRLQFSDWVSGDLIVHEVEWDIENGINRAKGIANNLVYS